MRYEVPFNIPGPRPVIAGTGLIALDVVIPDGPNSLPQLWAGGTCGNVLAALSYLGWDVYPIARLRDDAASRQITQDFSRWGVKLDFVELDPTGSTPVIVQHIHDSPHHGATHSFSRKCPFCGTRLPWYKPVRVSDATRIFPKLRTPTVFFFDRTSAGALYLARQAAGVGRLVVFEPSAAATERELRQAMHTSHIVKYSEDRMGDLEGLALEVGVPLLIETRGSEGLRYRPRFMPKAGGWELSKAIPVRDVVDTSGCGDWCSAGLIGALGRRGAEGLFEVTPAELREALHFGQALAAWNCGFEGARGGMYHSDVPTFQESIRRLLAGDDRYTPIRALQNGGPVTGFLCATCGERPALSGPVTP